MSVRTDSSVAGLRERKKARTRAAIQQHALRLFREQGYGATTVEQIAEAAEVSASTFFRYFPTKEDVALYDALDPLLISAFEAQPLDLNPIQALRRAMRVVAAELPAEELAIMRERFDLIRDVPELRSRMLNEFVTTIDITADLVAARLQRAPDDFAVRALAGALIGVSLAVMLTVEDDPSADLLTLMDQGMAYLESGLPL